MLVSVGFLFSAINLFLGFQFLEFYKNISIVLMISIFALLAIVCEYVTRIYFQLKKTERNIYEKKLTFEKRIIK